MKKANTFFDAKESIDQIYRLIKFKEKTPVQDVSKLFSVGKKHGFSVYSLIIILKAKYKIRTRPSDSLNTEGWIHDPGQIADDSYITANKNIVTNLKENKNQGSSTDGEKSLPKQNEKVNISLGHDPGKKSFSEKKATDILDNQELDERKMLNEKLTGENVKPNLNINWIFAVLAVSMIFFSLLKNRSNTKPLSTSDIKEMIVRRDIEKIVVVNKDHADIYLKKAALESGRYLGVSKPGAGFGFSRPKPNYKYNIGDISNFEPFILEAQKVAGYTEAELIYPDFINIKSYFIELLEWMLPFVVLFLLWMFFLKRKKKKEPIEKSNGNKINPFSTLNWIIIVPGVLLIFFTFLHFRSNPLRITTSEIKTMILNRDIEKIVVVNKDHADIYLTKVALESGRYLGVSKPGAGFGFSSPKPNYKYNIGDISNFEPFILGAQKKVGYQDNDLIYPDYINQKDYYNGIIVRVLPFAFLILLLSYFMNRLPQ